ncbi:MAG: sensor histidine kinase [Desulfocapsa sp.]|nr:MAG: sensor histidine kinase [Desulfocapsa sp.]
MKIRNRITLWITGAGLLAGLLFSIVISYELIEQPFELLDGELDNQAHTLLAGIDPGNGLQNTYSDTTMLDSMGRLYWFKIFNGQQEMVYHSAITSYVGLPLRKDRKKYTVSVTIPRNIAALEQDDSDEVTFRVGVFVIPFSGQDYLVQIARPMEKLQEEIIDLIIAIIIGLLFFAITLLLAGYFVAGKILEPIAHINTLIREINDKTLDKRIPPGRNQDELFVLASSLNKMFDRLQFSFTRQKEFIANASHELKTPIAMQRLFLGEALQRNDLPVDLSARLVSQSEIVQRMDRLVKSLLAISTLELKETYTPTQIDLKQMLTTILYEFEESLLALDIHLETELEDAVLLSGDEEKLRRMFVNLIDNAIKYIDKEKRQIRVSLNKENTNARIVLYNTGDGIPPAEQDRIFDQFYRIEKSRNETSGGSGLGLTIVRRIVELHHGRIEIESEYEKWVRFHIVLPLNGR